MKQTICIFLVLGALLISSCKKETEIPTEKSVAIDSSKLFLNDAISDPESEFYISGEFDGHKIYCATVYGDRFPYNDTGFNALYVNDSIGLDNIHLVRENNDLSIMMAIYFDQANIFNQSMPFKLPIKNPTIYQSAELEIINMRGLSSAPPNSTQNDYSFWSQTGNGFVVQVNSLADSILEGTFKGFIQNPKRSRIEVQNGKFRIKIKVIPVII